MPGYDVNRRRNHDAETMNVHAGLDSLAGRALAVELASLALIEVRGGDAESFLQGQFSSDVAALGDELDETGARRCQLNAYCNPKGRALALIKLIRCAAGFWMIVPTALADGLVNRLEMFVLRADVDIALRPKFSLLGWIPGDEKNDDLTGDMIDEPGDRIERVAVGGVRPRQILIGEKSALDSVSRAHDDDVWRLLDIHSGIPQIYPQTAGAFIPQTINLDLIDGLSFTKGCYPGQEIIARLRYRGKVKQRMIAGIAHGLARLAPGDPVYTQRGAQKAGLVVDAVQTGEREYTFSATAPVDHPEHETLLVGPASAESDESAAQAPVTRLPLPYAARAHSA